MRILLVCFCALLFGSMQGSAASAIDALKNLAPDQLMNLAMIAARDGTPEPERWHVLVYDSTSETGLREIVVGGGKKTSERSFSQFAARLTAADVLGPDSLRMDSDRVARLALQFGATNRMPVSALHFDLRKSSPDGAPLWTVTCMDAAGNELGKIVVSASSGAVLIHPGFPTSPNVELIAERPRAPAPGSELARGESPEFERTNAPKKRPGRSAATTPAPPQKSGFLQRIFGGGNSANRP
jgi:hypothetical protein